MHQTDGFGAEESGYIDPDDDTLKVEFKGQLWHMSELTMDERKFVRFREKRNELAAQLTLDADKTRQAIHRKKVKLKQKRLGLKWKKSEQNRYNMLLFAELAVERKADLYQLCTWGCGGTLVFYVLATIFCFDNDFLF